MTLRAGRTATGAAALWLIWTPLGTATSPAQQARVPAVDIGFEPTPIAVADRVAGVRYRELAARSQRPRGEWARPAALDGAAAAGTSARRRVRSHAAARGRRDAPPRPCRT